MSDTIPETVAAVLDHDAKATPGPWNGATDETGDGFVDQVKTGEGVFIGMALHAAPSELGVGNGFGSPEWADNAALIAYYRTAAPALAREVQRLEKANDALHLARIDMQAERNTARAECERLRAGLAVARRTRPKKLGGDLPRFWSKTRPDGDCIIWTGHVCKDGYGRFATDAGNRKQRHHRAHRWIYEQLVAPVPSHLVIRHRCDRPGCVNVNHLETGTQAENIADKTARGKSPQGERNPNAKVTEDLVLFIRSEVASGKRQIDVANAVGLTRFHVNLIIRRRCWRHLP